MSSKKTKAQLWREAVKVSTKNNSVRLLAHWWAIHIIKPAFLKKDDIETKKVLEQILRSRGVKLEEPKEYRTK